MIDTLWRCIGIVVVGACVGACIWLVTAIIEDINELRELWRNKK